MDTWLDTASDRDRNALLGWFDSARAARHWGGPALPYPFDAARFANDLRWDECSNYALRDRPATLLGFGQVYERWGRIQLARLAVEPRLRGRGLGDILVRALMIEGQRRHPLPEFSLFVCNDNHAAITLYRKLGFRESACPEPAQSLAGCSYMIREVD